ncbi:unnamed protein product [Spirodela intermedia]|uniref:Uncharacterized protein n=1 Tax=Spirodela intermedia TaxID=51605 RepID=A0ABN7EBI1_SPIIN|nr:unnamed protein product [Spirodela intermedia]
MPSKPEVLIDLSDSAYPLYAYTALHYRPLHGSGALSITRHNHDIIMVLVLYHRCGMYLSYQHKTDDKTHRNPPKYTSSNHYSHNHLTSTIYHPQAMRTHKTISTCWHLPTFEL